ncbi:MAG: LytTR family DNA-binding domain-containing protein [Bacteroidales bacterium]|nr:LytTR family DNA-binding domain-containing protein [Bacteroidales bacterium]MCF8396849.1 LytTR family DNA-binding domain-containing protein [Bacteroidales bacterium]
MLRTLIVDDEAKPRKAIANLIDYYCKDVLIVGEAYDVSSGKMAIEKFEPDLVLLDIEMPDGTGFDLLKAVDEIDFKIIFITAHEQYALKAIKFSALDYLLKPVNPDELKEAIKKAERSKKEELNIKLNAFDENYRRRENPNKLVLNTSSSIYVVSTEDIIRCESDQNYTRIFFVNRDTIIVSRTLKEFDEILTEQGFFRVHQSHLINLAYIDHYEKGLGGILVLKNKVRIPVSSRRKERFLRLFDAYRMK